MKKKQPGKFQTHIPEPRWQQIVSVAIVAVLFAVELLIILKVL